MPEEVDARHPIRYLLRSPRWTARLARRAILASLLIIPIFLAYAQILGGPRFFVDFPLLQRIVLCLAPPGLVIAIFATRGELRILLALLMIWACQWLWTWTSVPIETIPYAVWRPPADCSAGPLGFGLHLAREKKAYWQDDSWSQWSEDSWKNSGLLDIQRCALQLHIPAAFDRFQEIKLTDLYELGIGKETLVAGDTEFSEAELDALRQRDRCYYEFLIKNHPGARKSRCLVMRLLEFVEELHWEAILQLPKSLPLEERLRLLPDDPCYYLAMAYANDEFEDLVPVIRADPSRWSVSEIHVLRGSVSDETYCELAALSAAAGGDPLVWIRFAHDLMDCFLETIPLDERELSTLAGLIRTEQEALESLLAKYADQSPDAALGLQTMRGEVAIYEQLQHRNSTVLAAALYYSYPLEERKLLARSGHRGVKSLVSIALQKQEAILLTLFSVFAIVGTAFLPQARS